MEEAAASRATVCAMICGACEGYVVGGVLLIPIQKLQQEPPTWTGRIRGVEELSESTAALDVSLPPSTKHRESRRLGWNSWSFVAVVLVSLPVDSADVVRAQQTRRQSALLELADTCPSEGAKGCPAGGLGDSNLLAWAKNPVTLLKYRSIDLICPLFDCIHCQNLFK